jgi:hypothetical protein
MSSTVSISIKVNDYYVMNSDSHVISILFMQYITLEDSNLSANRGLQPHA